MEGVLEELDGDEIERQDHEGTQSAKRRTAPFTSFAGHYQAFLLAFFVPSRVDSLNPAPIIVMIINPPDHDYRDIYKLMIGAIVPRPIAFVSTLSREGILNLAPFSFFTGVSANPPVICFSPMIRGSDGNRKDTLNNIETTREFVVNIVSEDFAVQMNICSTEFPPEVDEFQQSGLTPISSDLVKAPRVKESKINLECRLLQVLHVSPKPLGGSLVLGEVLRFHIADELWDDYRIDPNKLRPIGRMGGPTYTRTTDRFDLVRPKAGEIKST